MELKNTIIEKRNNMNKEELMTRLRGMDEEAELRLSGPERYDVTVVGGSAFILLGRLTRATHDIDLVSVPPALFEIMSKWDMNNRVEAYIYNFPYNFPDRRRLIYMGEKIDFFVPCLEDLVIAKLCSVRDTDRADIESEEVRNHLDWDLLGQIAYDDEETKYNMSDQGYSEFMYRYKDYVERWHK